MTFDPYRKWLSIPEGQRPPTHYQLLGISPDEQDREVINAAVVRQSAFVRHFQTGKHAAEATRLLGEIAAAKVCLLDPAKRTAYDAELRKRAKAPLPSPSQSGELQHSPSGEPPAAERKPFSSQTLAAHPAATAPAVPVRSAPRSDWSPPPSDWTSPPPDWATCELPGDDADPATSSEALPVPGGLSFSDTLWNEISDLPTPPPPSSTAKKIPVWIWGLVAGLLGLVIVVVIVVLLVKSAPPPDSPGRGQDPGETGMDSPSPAGTRLAWSGAGEAYA